MLGIASLQELGPDQRGGLRIFLRKFRILQILGEGNMRYVTAHLVFSDFLEDFKYEILSIVPYHYRAGVGNLSRLDGRIKNYL